MGIALSGFKQNFDLLLDGLPAAYQSVFNDSKNRTNDQVSINIAWGKIAGTLSEFISSGVASKTEIANAIRRAESRLNNNENSEDDQSNNDSDEANFRGVA
ncbi:MAG: hypothetical protein NT027_09750 [Proteobacteria bacterium]|nr:hypothetical protein [Pseudomonadota bacterium]